MGWAEHKYLKVDGVNVHYVEAGEGPVVLLLHGLASSLFTWYRNVDTLVSAGYRVVALDLPGHGDSDKPRHLSYDPASGAELVHQFLEAQGIASVAAVGNSAGGLILGLVALAHPDFVQRLVLVASGGLVRGVCWSLRLMSVPGLGELLYRPKLENPLVLSRRIFHQQPDFIEEVLPEMCRVRTLPGSREATIKSVRSSINLFGQRKQRNILHRLKQLSLPLLTVWGAEDSIIPVSHATQVQETLPNSVVRILPNCGHWPHMEKDQEFNPLLVQFLDGELDQRPAQPPT